MADKNISELQTAAEIALTDYMHLRQGGVDRKAPVEQVRNKFNELLTEFKGDLANGTDPAKGAALVGYNGTTIAGALQGFWSTLDPVVMPWTSVDGGTLTQPNQAFLHPANGNYYSWTGAYPSGGRVVPPGTDPTAVAGYVPRSSGSTLVSHKSPIANTISRTLYSKINDSALTINDFGADPSGVLDSTTAIQNAFNSGFDIDITDGTYKISRTITASTRGVRVTASPGAILKKTTAADAIVVTGSNWELIGVRVNCNGFGASGIGIKGANNLVSACEVYGSAGIIDAHGIYLDGQATICVYNRVVNNWIHQVGGVGIASNTAPDNIKEGNVTYQTGLEGITNDLPSYRSIISGNYINAACQLGGVGGIGIDQGSEGVVTNNVVNSTGSGLPGIKFQNNVGNTNFVTVTGNTITNNPGGGIWLYNNVSSGFKAFYNVINSNTFSNNTGFDIKIDAGCSGNSVSGNSLNAVIIDANVGGVNPKSGVLCSFRAYSNALQSNVTGDGTSYQVRLGATVFNNGAPWNTSTNTFTAPVTGIYSFSGGCRIQGGGPSTFALLQLIQAGSVSQTAQAELDMTTNITLSTGTVVGSGVYNLHVADMFAMQAGDTLVMKISAFGSTKTMSIPASPVQTWLSGVIVG